MKRSLYFTLVFLFFSKISVSTQDCAVPKMPNEFKLVEKVISLTTAFELKSKNGDLGTVTEKLISLTTTFTYKDDKGGMVATAKEALISWGTRIDVYDCKDRLIGTLQEKVFKSLFKAHTNYSILDAQGNEIAISEKLDLLATSITLSGKDGSVFVELKRPMFNLFSDTWNIKVHPKNTVDFRIIVIVAAFKTAADNERADD